MKLPRTLLGRACLLAAPAAAVAAFAAFSPLSAGAHPGPVDTSGGHYCTQAQSASGLCAPPTYHRHDASGGQVVVTPGPEAAQLTGQQDPTAPQPTPTPTTVAVVPGGPPPATTPVSQDLAQTGPMSMEVAAFGGILTAMGLVALFSHRHIPLPVVLELERRNLS